MYVLHYRNSNESGLICASENKDKLKEKMKSTINENIEETYGSIENFVEETGNNIEDLWVDDNTWANNDGSYSVRYAIEEIEII